MSGTGFSFELTRPVMLWLLLLCVPIAYTYRRSLSNFPARQRFISYVVRSVIVTLLILALAGLAWQSQTRRQFVVFVIDDSLSVSDQANGVVNRFVEQAVSSNTNAQTRFAFAQVAGQTSLLVPTLEQLRGLDSPQRGRTNLAAAIELVSATIPAGFVPQIVLLTDGRETHGSADLAAAASRCPVSVVPLPVRSDPEVQIAAVAAPAQVRQGEPFQVEVVVSSNHTDQGQIEVYRGDVLVTPPSQTLVVQAGENRFQLQQSINNESHAEFVVRIRGFQDTLLENNRASAVVYASGKPTVLVIDPTPDESKHLQWALQQQDVLVQVRPPDGIPRSLSELQKFECCILSNVPATDMSVQQMRMLRDYVERLGGGLVVIGGDQAFGLGGYYTSVLEEILPVRSNFEKEKEKPSLAMVLVIDKSGSMGGQKIELAKDAAKGAVELLGPRDQLGVIAFDGHSHWVSQLRSAADKQPINHRIAAISANGGTSIYPALADAFAALNQASSKLKHVILLSDGRSAPGDFVGLAGDMAAARITLSSVAVGQQADRRLLEQLAQNGGGRYYECTDPSYVPQIFAKETIEASKSAISELPFSPQIVRPTRVLDGIDLTAAPYLLGYVITRPKPTSEFILASDTADPVLAWWRYGLGMTVAFTSDAKSRWAAEWLTWPDFGRFWAQIVRHAMRKLDAQGVFTTVHRDNDTFRVVVDTVDEIGAYINDAETRMTVIRPDLEQQTLRMNQTAPGRYESVFAATDRGSYQLEISQSQHGVLNFRQMRGLVVGYPDELRIGPTNESLMRRIADVSGGRFDPSPQEIWNLNGATAAKITPLWPHLLMLSLLLFVADVALRRIELSI